MRGKHRGRHLHTVHCELSHEVDSPPSTHHIRVWGSESPVMRCKGRSQGRPLTTHPQPPQLASCCT